MLSFYYLLIALLKRNQSARRAAPPTFAATMSAGFLVALLGTANPAMAACSIGASGNPTIVTCSGTFATTTNTTTAAGFSTSNLTSRGYSVNTNLQANVTADASVTGFGLFFTTTPNNVARNITVENLGSVHSTSLSPGTSGIRVDGRESGLITYKGNGSAVSDGFTGLTLWNFGSTGGVTIGAEETAISGTFKGTSAIVVRTSGGTQNVYLNGGSITAIGAGGSNSGDGAHLFAEGAGNVNLTTTGSTTITQTTGTAGNGTVGIRASSAGGNIAIDTDANIGTSGNGRFGVGINASTTGTGTIDVTADGSIQTTGDGISATSANGKITINTDGSIAAGAHGISVSASGSGAVEIEVGESGSVAGASRGVSVSQAVSAAITNSGTIVGAGTSGNAVIYANTSGNTLAIDNKSGGLIANASDPQAASWSALLVQAAGGTPTEITNYGTMIGRLDLSSGGAVTFTNYSPTSWNTSGVTNFSNDADFVDNNGGTINTTGPSATVNFLDGNDEVLNRNGGTINTAGFTSLRFGAGADTLKNTGGSSSINTSGTTVFVFDNANMFLGFPVSNSGTQYDDRFINTRGATFDAGGITSFWFGGGSDIFENSRGASFYGDGVTTINLGSGDDQFINEKGALFDVDGVTTLTFGSGADTLLNRRGAELLAHGVSMTITGLETLTNTTGATIELSALANTVTGLTTLTNSRGADFGADGLVNTFSFGSGDDIFTNDRGGRFEVSNVSTFLFHGGSDTFNNLRGGRFVSDGVTTFSFGGGAGDTVNNASGGRISVDGLLTFAGLEFFNNGSDAGRGTLDMRNGHTGDLIVMLSGGGNSLEFSGAEGRSFLSIDAFLRGPGDDSADLLVVDGAVTGRTQIKVVNLNEGVSFLDLQGVKVVQAATSAGDGSEFFLDAPVKAGLFDYGLFFDNSGETDDWYLRNGVNGDGHALGSLHASIASLYTIGAGPWTERMNELHDNVVAGHGPVSAPYTSGPGGGIWGTVFGGARDHDATFTTLITTYDGSYRQSAAGFLGGIDTVVDIESDGTLLAGVAGGYLGSSLAFASEGASGTMRGASVGGYLSYMNSGLFADLLVKADFLSIGFSAGGSNADTNGHAIGAIADVGYRMDSGEMFIEPIATLAYVNVSTSTFELLGTDIRFPNSNNVVGRLGARAGMTGILDEEARLDTFISASVWNNFAGGAAATIVSDGGDAVTIANAGSGLYFEVGAGVEVVNLVNGLSGFIRGDYQFGKSIQGGSGRGGMRVNW